MKREELAKKVEENETFIIVKIGTDLFLIHENGGYRGSYGNPGTTKIDKTVSPTRKISISEARCLMIDWDCDREI